MYRTDTTPKKEGKAQQEQAMQEEDSKDVTSKDAEAQDTGNCHTQCLFFFHHLHLCYSILKNKTSNRPRQSQLLIQILYL